MTVDTAQLLARYNAHANGLMNQVLGTLTAEEWEADRRGYFSSFRALTGHLYTVDIHWMVRFTGLRPFSTVRGEPFDFPPSFGAPPFGGVEEYLGLRTALDDKITALVDELTDADLAADLEYRNSRGETFTKNLGGLLVHWFNHQTHHRGSISYLLDTMGKANDFSNVTAVL